MLRFQLPDYPDPYSTYDRVHMRPVTRIRCLSAIVPELESRTWKTFCVKRICINLVYCFNVSYLPLLVSERVWIIGYFRQNFITYESNEIVSRFKNDWLLYFYIPFSPPGGKKADPYFRENESLEASGSRRTEYYRTCRHRTRVDLQLTCRGTAVPLILVSYVQLYPGTAVDLRYGRTAVASTAVLQL
jgi:hypothetical protein